MKWKNSTIIMMCHGWVNNCLWSHVPKDYKLLYSFDIMPISVLVIALSLYLFCASIFISLTLLWFWCLLNICRLFRLLLNCFSLFRFIIGIKLSESFIQSLIAIPYWNYNKLWFLFWSLGDSIQSFNVNCVMYGTIILTIFIPLLV